ncbi:EAL domain-containing protein [Vibrio sp. VB16]|uniref:EAL domain-containing protein n=1 Tax=Vibrio sp. VB16 TaxID=2785746 RepID=UPI00189E944E|nr:EAL domain-containing protein [Vibrio sp. VB16]UGA56648.1 EAL domain-containing protein [Vibrio sp. VB16]
MGFIKKYKTTISMLVVWSILIAGSLSWNIIAARENIISRAYSEAKTSINKDITFRLWGSSHGGVYVPVSDKQQPIKWLSHIPNRDVKRPDGTMLTLVNPAAMLRQSSEKYATLFGIQSRITSLKPINKFNAPDAWETQQLTAFEQGVITESWDTELIDGVPNLRYLRAMNVEEGCLKCHASQGYRLGDIRGGIGVSLPLTEHYQLVERSINNLSASHSILWVLGGLGIFLYSNISSSQVKERQQRDIEREESAEVLGLYASAFSSSGEAMLIIDQDQKIINANRAFLKHSGYSIGDVISRNWAILHADNTPISTYLEMTNTLEDKGFWQGESYGRKKDGSVFPKWLSISKIKKECSDSSFYISTYSDISERKEAEKEIAHLAHFDILTDLHNRYSLEERLERVLERAQKYHYKAAMLFIDLDRFKTINDSLGHAFGDKLIIEVAHELSKIKRDQDTLARIGGDEFVLILPQVTDTSDVALVAQRIQEKLNKLYHISNRDVETSASIGICLYPDDGTTTVELMKNADIAMYQAKLKGRNNYQFFTTALSQAADERLKLENQMRVALELGQFEIYFQPIVNTNSLSIVSAEALIRWKHPEHGFYPPDKFIPIAEDTGFIHTLGDWILNEACHSFSQIKQRGCGLKKISINLSVNQLQSTKLIDKVNKAMKKYGISVGELEFEITETAAMQDPDFAVSQLTALSNLGISLAIDDFGTGYSSLSYLKKLPIQTLKVDRTFVSDIGKDTNNEEICITTISLAHNLGLQVVAEGVETEEQIAFLKQHHCDRLQGYYFSRPVPINELCLYIEQNTAPPRI